MIGSENDDDEPGGLSLAADLLDEYVRAFELAYRYDDGADPAAYLPPADHPLHAAVLRELVRVDLEFRWERGCPKDLSEYLLAFPALAEDHEGLLKIAFEEYRLRHRAGHEPSPEEYLSRYGLRLESELVRFRSLAPSRRGNDRAPGSPLLPFGPGRFNGDGCSLAPTLKPDEKDFSRGTIDSMPAVGDEFLGFRLIGELGQGSFGRVYLARQGEMAGRPVVLKVTADGSDESQTLAQLQHENIVPVYSRHRAGRLRAVCMPYLGSVTLRDVTEDLKAQEALPESGRGLLNSLGKSSVRKGIMAAPIASEPSPAAPGSGSQAVLPGRDSGDDTRTLLDRLTFVEAVVWMGSRLADGLAHAHDRGILHRDMKPANVLLTDDGRPMLLDFNLAEDLKLRGSESGGGMAGVGGTLPYMAPEHLAAFQDFGLERDVDARSDLYAFGVILFEVLTGRPPFPARDGMRPDLVRVMIADRQGPPPRLRPLNPAVSPAVEAIVRRCLDPEPARRYGSARELAEDLQRHLAHRPLRYADEPSHLERAMKWGRRNRRWLVSMVVFAIGAVIVGGFLQALRSRTNTLAQFESRAALQRFRVRSITAMNLLSLGSASSGLVQWHEGQIEAREALDVFHVCDDRAPALGVPWWGRSPADRLLAPERDRLRVEAGELLLMLARSRVIEAAFSTDQGARERLWREAEKENERSGECFDFGLWGVPRTVWDQRREILKHLGDGPGAAMAEARGKAVPRAAAIDSLLMGIEAAQEGRSAEAVALLEAAIQHHPDRYWAWLALGHAQNRHKHHDAAFSSYSTCIALWPEHPAAWVNRGLVALQISKYEQALADFKQALLLRPGDPVVLADRATAAFHLGQYAEAIRGFDAAIARGLKETRVYFMRAQAREKAGDPEGARRDRQEGLRREPTEESSWIARALFRAGDNDAVGALSDLDRALQLNPRSFKAIQNKVYVLAEKSGKTAEAIAWLDRLLELYPHSVAQRSTRAVLLGRLGRRDAALADVRDVLELDPSPLHRYEAAGVYALTSLREPGDREEALRLLASSLRQAPAIVDLAESDPDLNPIRTAPEYIRIIARAKAAAVKAVPKPGPSALTDLSSN